MKIKPSQEGKVDVAIWVCIFGGLLSVAASVAISDVAQEAAWWLGGAGSLATGLGIVLIYIRSKT